jgi:putative FmdB family regulatory protein
MPIYPYHCPYCESDFDVIRKASDNGIEECPKCDQTLFKENRSVGSVSFDLKGTGWYRDGYAQGDNNCAIGNQKIRY